MSMRKNYDTSNYPSKLMILFCQMNLFKSLYFLINIIKWKIESDFSLFFINISANLLLVFCSEISIKIILYTIYSIAWSKDVDSEFRMSTPVSEWTVCGNELRIFNTSFVNFDAPKSPSPLDTKLIDSHSINGFVIPLIIWNWVNL